MHTANLNKGIPLLGGGGGGEANSRENLNLVSILSPKINDLVFGSKFVGSD